MKLMNIFYTIYLWISFSDVTVSVEEDNQNIAFAKKSLVVQQSNVHSTSTLENLVSSEAVSKRSTLITRINQVTSENNTPSTDHSFVSDVTSSITQDPVTFDSKFTSSRTKGHVTPVDGITSTNGHGHVSRTSQFPGTSVGTEGTTRGTAQTDVSPPAFSKVSFIDRCDRRVRCSVRRSLKNTIWPPPLPTSSSPEITYCRCSIF